jgi:hypothetical protein
MAGEDFKLENRFSSSRGIFPYVVGALGVGVVVVLFMIITGIGRNRLPYSDYFFAVRAPEAADGSEALSLQSLTYKDNGKTVEIAGSIMNRTENPISGLLAVLAVTDKYTLPVETVSVPVEPSKLDPMGMGTFQTTVTLAEHGFGGYSLQFKLPDNGPFVPHKDERPPEPETPPSESKPSK